MPFIVELEGGVFLSPESGGDPPRTLVIHSAKLFRSIHAARVGLEKARVFRPFAGARVVPVTVRLFRMQS